MYKKGLAYKFLSLLSLLNLSLQPFFNFLIVSVPSFAFAQETLEAKIAFDKSGNSFELSVNTNKEVHYELFYRTDSQIENVSGTSKNKGENFFQEIYAGTCSSGGICAPHRVLRGILKIEVKDKNWLTAQKFTIDNGKLNLVEENDASGLDLTKEENRWLVGVKCLTDESVKESTDRDWNLDKEKGVGETKEKVELGVKYAFPLDNKVSVTFKCLPEIEFFRTPLRIQQIKVSDLKLPEGVNPYGEYAYDITTGMEEGIFEYDITLPKPENAAAEVSYIEKSVDDATKNEIKADEVKVVEEEKVEQEGDKVKVGGLDHFTIFVVVNPLPSGTTEGTACTVGSLNGDSGVCASEPPTDKKVILCHAAGQAGTLHYNTLTVSYHAAYGNGGHFYENGTPRAGHEQDYLGACKAEDLCGNGNLDSGEQCDDGNINNSDGCHDNCTVEAPLCSEETGWATGVDSSIQGTLKNGDPILDPTRTNPYKTLGANDEVFFSLGYGGSIILSFVQWITDTEGNDLSFHETTWGRNTYPTEKAEVFVSQNGSNWQSLGEVTNKDNVLGVSYKDISGTGWNWVKYVKLVDTTDDPSHIATADGYDLDAVGVVAGVCEKPQTKATVKICKEDSGKNKLSGWQVVLREQSPVETVEVLPTGASFTSSSLPASDYVLRASGYYTYRPGTAGAEYTDANFSKRAPSDSVYSGPYAPWVNVNNFPDSIKGWLGVMVNDSATNWSDVYNPDHVYALGYANYSGTFSFKILDDNYSDNSGNIPVGIYHGWTKFTGEDGCATFENMALGNYYVEEILQDSWVNDSGTGAVTVDQSEETFTIINHKVLPRCGDGVKNGSEQCDDGNLDDHDGCSSLCKTEYPITFKKEVAGGSAKPGDWSFNVTGYGTAHNGDTVFFVPGYYPITESGPDHYNLGGTSGSCHSSSGKIELAVSDTDQNFCTIINTYVPYCGDGNIDAGEECDGSAGVGQNQFCTSNCKLVPIYNGGGDCPEGTVKSQTPIATKTISATDADGETFELISGGKYLFEVTGNYNYGQGRLADAAYAVVGTDWTSAIRNDIGIWGTNRGITSLLADLGNGIGLVEWDNDLIFNPDHTYQKYYSPTKSSARFLISDWYDNWFTSDYNNQKGIPDNSGSLTLNVYECQNYGSVEVYKFEDLNGDGQKDDGEPLLPDWEILLGGQTATTSAEGKATFADLVAGEYDLSETLKEGWQQTGIYCDGDGTFGDGKVIVTVGANINCYIGNFKLGSISGAKIYDRNDNGAKEDGEGGIEGWKIYLSGGSLAEEISTLTDSNGHYEFTGLTAGAYTVREEDRSSEGWRASNPESGQSNPIAISSGTNAQFNFFNAPPVNIVLTKSNNATAPVKPSDLVEYTLTITIGERTLSEMSLIDILPDGFSYQTGTTSITTTLGSSTTTVNTEPTLKRANKKLVWTWPAGVSGGSILVIKYTVKIDSANKPSSYTNFAYVWGSGSPTMVESQIVDSVVKIEPAYAVESKVAGGEILGTATQIEEGAVLGATTLPAAGASTWFLLAAIALIGAGLALRPKNKKQENN